MIDITGHKFNRWTVICRVENTKLGQARWLCRCDCGNERQITSATIRQGFSKSCGCLKSELTLARNKKHGHSRIGWQSPTYRSWAAMRGRCENPKNSHFAGYGGRGIKVCARWAEFVNFLADMGEKPEGLSIDRIDVNGNYEPGNCRWATNQQQARNKRNNRFVTANGKTQTVAEWCRETGINASTYDCRVRAGWTKEDAATTPPGATSKSIKWRMLTHRGLTMRAADWSRRLNIPTQTIYQRLHRGATDDEALVLDEFIKRP